MTWSRWFAWKPVENVKKNVEVENGHSWYESDVAFWEWIERRRSQFGMEYRRIGCDYDY